MICIKTVKRFCNEDISLIENYDKAIEDLTQTWDCHHRKEIELKLSGKQLDELGLYFNRPANELIFLTHAEHSILHNKGKNKSNKHKIKISESMKGYIPFNTGKHRVYDNKELKIYHYE